MITNHNFFWVPKLIQKICPTIEQKLVQRCETEILANCLQCLLNDKKNDEKKISDKNEEKKKNITTVTTVTTVLTIATVT